MSTAIGKYLFVRHRIAMLANCILVQMIQGGMSSSLHRSGRHSRNTLNSDQSFSERMSLHFSSLLLSFFPDVPVQTFLHNTYIFCTHLSDKYSFNALTVRLTPHIAFEFSNVSFNLISDKVVKEKVVTPLCEGENRWLDRGGRGHRRRGIPTGRSKRN